VSCSMYEFKDNIKKTIALSGSGILEDEFLILKATYLHSPMVLKRQSSDVRAMRVLTQLVWTTVCTYLMLKDEVNALALDH